MAVDLTTGSYDEEGIFNKYNDAPKSAEKDNPVNDFCSLKNFRVLKVIKENTIEKTLVVEGRFVGDDRRAIVAIEKMNFDERDLTKMFTEESRVEIKFRNDIYAKYHVYPANGFNGMSIKVIHPATEKDFSKYIDDPVVMVYELKRLYDNVVGPHFRVAYQNQNRTEVERSAVLMTHSSDKLKFVLINDDVHNCCCSNKHIRAKAVVRKDDLLSLRDLTSADLPLLLELKKLCLEKLTKEFKIPASQIQGYVFYPPPRFPFQVIFESVEKDEEIAVGKVHYLDTIISNLRLVPDYYQKVTLSYFISEKNSLGRKISSMSAQAMPCKKIICS